MDKTKRAQLDEDGFCIIPGILSEEFLGELRSTTQRILEALPAEHEQENRSTGSMVSVYEDPIFAKLITLPAAQEALRSLGFTSAGFTSGYVISKPPKSPRLFWHYDWAGWDAPESFTGQCPQIFFMYYLTNTRRENGCLRVIPGTHRRDNDLIPLLTEAHTPEVLRAADPASADFADRPDEIDVPIVAGDLLIGDSRLLHASHANESDERRTVITLWFHPDTHTLGDRLQAFIGGLVSDPPADWPEALRDETEPFLARYDGDAEPWPWNRHRPYPAPVA